MAYQDGDHPGGEAPAGGDPLLVRPFLLRDQALPAASASAATWPSAGDPAPGPEGGDGPPPGIGETPYREIRSHRGGPPDAPDPRRRHGAHVLAAAGVAALIGLAAVGYGLLRPAPEDGDVPIPSGALPPLPSAATTAPPSPATSRAAGTSPRAGRSPAAAPGTTPATPPPATAPEAAPSGTVALRPPVAGVPAPVAPPTAARVGRITAGDLCLDLNGGVPADDNHVQVYDCNDSVAQRWTLAPDGTLQVLGKCAHTVGDATVHIVSCDGRSTAQWRTADGGALVNLANRQCLTDPDNGTRSGTAVRVAPCEGADNQQWSLP